MRTFYMEVIAIDIISHILFVEEMQLAYIAGPLAKLSYGSGFLCELQFPNVSIVHGPIFPSV